MATIRALATAAAAVLLMIVLATVGAEAAIFVAMWRGQADGMR